MLRWVGNQKIAENHVLFHVMCHVMYYYIYQFVSLVNQSDKKVSFLQRVPGIVKLCNLKILFIYILLAMLRVQRNVGNI